jgi:heptosyltransferase II
MLASSVRPAQPFDHTHRAGFMRIGVFLPNWVGDVVMATPALRALRTLAGPEGALIGIMRTYVSEVLAGTTWLDNQIFYDKTKQRLGMPSREFFRELRGARLDQVVLLTNSMRTALIAWRSGARERVGYRGEGRSLLLTKRVRPGRAADGGLLPSADGYLEIARAAGCRAESVKLELGTTAEDERATDIMWQRLSLPPGDRVVVLNSGGAYGAAKQWPAEYFAELARRIVANERYSVLVNCGPSEREIAREIASRASHPRVVTLANEDDLPVGLTKACIRRSRLLVTTDSGPRFFGVAFQRPVITVFGPTDPVRTQLHYERETRLSLALDCQPCMARTCPLGHHRCMRDLSVEMVYRAAMQALESGAGECAA